MGQSKLLLPWQGRPLLEHTLRAWRQSGVTAIFVIVRPHDDELAAIVRQSSARLVLPPRDPREMKESVGYALATIARQERPSAADVWLLAPADMPTLNPASVRHLLKAHRPEKPSILVPQHGAKRGHPVLFPWPLAREVGQLPADQGVNALLHRHPVREIASPDASVLHDIDTPDDYQRLTASPSHTATHDDSSAPNHSPASQACRAARPQSPKHRRP